MYLVGHGIYYTSSLVAVVTVDEFLSEYIYETDSQITDVTDYETTQVEIYWIGSRRSVPKYNTHTHTYIRVLIHWFFFV